MAHKYTSVTETDTFIESFGIKLEFEKVFSEADFLGKESFFDFLEEEGYVVKTLVASPKKPKGAVIYENVSYPEDRLVIKDGSIYLSKVRTSEVWDLSEWDIKVKGQ